MWLFLTQPNPIQAEAKKKSMRFLALVRELVTQKVRINDPNIFPSCENMPYGLNPLFSNLYKLQPSTFMTFVCIPSPFWPSILQLWAPSQRAETSQQLKIHLTQRPAWTIKFWADRKERGGQLSAPKQPRWIIAVPIMCLTPVIVHFLFTIRN